MKKILIITPFFYPHTGGSQQYMEGLYAAMLKHYPDLSVSVLCYQTIKHTPSFEKYRGINIYRIPAISIIPNQFSLPNPIKLTQFLAGHKSDFDLYHCSTRFFDSSWWGPVYAKLIKKPVILTDHCADFPVHESKIISFFARIADITLCRFFLNLFDRLYTTNKATRKFLLIWFNKKSKIIYGGVDTKIFYPQKIKKHDRLKIIYVGRMIKSKGVTDFFNLAKNIKDQDFYFAGPGPLEKTLMKEIKKLKLPNIKILGRLNRKQTAKLMRTADILVHPSFHHEGFPNVLTEAGASRLAVLATDVGGSGEIIINNKTGLLVKPNQPKILAEKLNELIINKKLRITLSSNLYKYMIKTFTWEKIAEQMYREIKKLIKA